MEQAAGLFVRLDVAWMDNVKVIRVGLDGAGLHAMAMCLAKRTETDALLHRTQLYRVGATDELIDRLIEEGLFDPVEYGTRSGEDPNCAYVVRVHDWHDRNPSQAAIAASRSEKAKAAQAGNHKRWGHPGPVDSCAKCNPSQGAIASESQTDRCDDSATNHGSDDEVRPRPLTSTALGHDPSMPSPEPPPDNQRTPRLSQGAIASESQTDRRTTPVGSPETETETETETDLLATSEDGFDEWWHHWPKKEKRLPALKAWRRLSKADRTAALEALPRHRAHWARKFPDGNKQFIPHPATWLNARQWEDELEQRQPTGDATVMHNGVQVSARNRGSW